MKKRVLVVLGLLISLSVGVVAGFTLLKIAFTGSSAGYIGIGKQHLQEKNYVKAIAYFNRAIALDPNSFIAHGFLADAYYSAGHFDMALEEYEISQQLWQEEDSQSENKYIKARIEDIRKSLKK